MMPSDDPASEREADAGKQGAVGRRRGDREIGDLERRFRPRQLHLRLVRVGVSDLVAQALPALPGRDEGAPVADRLLDRRQRPAR